MNRNEKIVFALGCILIAISIILLIRMQEMKAELNILNEKTRLLTEELQKE